MLQCRNVDEHKRATTFHRSDSGGGRGLHVSLGLRDGGESQDESWRVILYLVGCLILTPQ